MPKERPSKLAKISYFAKVSRPLTVALCFLFHFPILCSTSLRERGTFLPPKSCSLTLLPLCAHSAVSSSLQPHGL